MEAVIRKVQQGDANTLAYIQTESWKAAFAGILDAETLESGKSLAKREILRMKDFASIAENPFDSDELISQIQSAYEIELDDDREDDDYV